MANHGTHTSTPCVTQGERGVWICCRMIQYVMKLVDSLTASAHTHMKQMPQLPPPHPLQTHIRPSPLCPLLCHPSPCPNMQRPPCDHLVQLHPQQARLPPSLCLCGSPQQQQPLLHQHCPQLPLVLLPPCQCPWPPEHRHLHAQSSRQQHTMNMGTQLQSGVIHLASIIVIHSLASLHGLCTHPHSLYPCIFSSHPIDIPAVVGPGPGRVLYVERAGRAADILSGLSMTAAWPDVTRAFEAGLCCCQPVPGCMWLAVEEAPGLVLFMVVRCRGGGR